MIRLLLLFSLVAGMTQARPAVIFPDDRVRTLMTSLGLDSTLKHEVRVSDKLGAVFLRADQTILARPVARVGTRHPLLQSPLQISYRDFQQRDTLRPLFTLPVRIQNETRLRGLRTRPPAPPAIDPAGQTFSLHLAHEIPEDKENPMLMQVRVFPVSKNGVRQKNTFLVVWQFGIGNSWADTAVLLHGVEPLKLPPGDDAKEPRSVPSTGGAIALLSSPRTTVIVSV